MRASHVGPAIGLGFGRTRPNVSGVVVAWALSWVVSHMRAGIVKPKPECRHCGAPLASSFARCRRCGKRSWTFLLPTWLRQH